MEAWKEKQRDEAKLKKAMKLWHETMRLEEQDHERQRQDFFKTWKEVQRREELKWGVKIQETLQQETLHQKV